MLFKKKEKDFGQELLNAYINRDMCSISKRKYKKVSKYLKEYFLKKVKDGVIFTTVNIYQVCRELNYDIAITEDETRTAIITFLENNHLEYKETRKVTTLTSKKCRVLKEVEVYLINDALSKQLLKEGVIE